VLTAKYISHCVLTIWFIPQIKVKTIQFACLPLFTSLLFVQSTNAMMTHPIQELKTDMMNNISTYVYITYEQAVISMIIL
jgi:hypothetical protein